MPKVWFVTGSSRGLGRAVVAAALDAGHVVAATARNPGDLDDLLKKYGNSVLPLKMDVTNGAVVQLAVDEAKEKFGSIDVVVNNAGYANLSAIEDTDLNDFRQQMDVNFFGTVRVSKAVVPIMREQGHGHIFQIGSVGSRIASLGLAPYQAAKFAVRAFSLVLAQEVAPLGIKVTTVEPGGMRTDWAGSSMHVPEASHPYRSTLAPFAQMLRDGSGKEPADPTKVAEVILRICDLEDAPAEILIGEDAYEHAQRAADAVAASDRKWKHVGTAVAY